MAHKKKAFFRIFSFFGLLTLLILYLEWGSYQDEARETGMMDQSMAGMMGMHLEGVTVSDLVRQQEQVDLSTGNSVSSHHNEAPSFLSTLHTLTTVAVVLPLPLIIAGTVFLTITWFNKKQR